MLIEGTQVSSSLGGCGFIWAEGRWWCVCVWPKTHVVAVSLLVCLVVWD